MIFRNNWYAFDDLKGASQPLPKERQFVVLSVEQLLEKQSSYPSVLLIGYLRFSGGDSDCPYFVHPGGHGFGKVLAFNDCLPDDFDYLAGYNQERGTIADAGYIRTPGEAFYLESVKGQNDDGYDRWVRDKDKAVCVSRAFAKEFIKMNDKVKFEFEVKI